MCVWTDWVCLVEHWIRIVCSECVGTGTKIHQLWNMTSPVWHSIYCHPVHTLYIATLFTFYIASMFTCSIYCHPVHTLYIATLFAHSILPPCSHTLYISTSVHTLYIAPCSHSILHPCSHALYIATLFTHFILPPCSHAPYIAGVDLGIFIGGFFFRECISNNHLISIWKLGEPKAVVMLV